MTFLTRFVELSSFLHMAKVSSFIGLTLLAGGPTTFLSIAAKYLYSKYVFCVESSEDESWDFSINILEDS